MTMFTSSNTARERNQEHKTSTPKKATRTTPRTYPRRWRKRGRTTPRTAAAEGKSQRTPPLQQLIDHDSVRDVVGPHGHVRACKVPVLGMVPASFEGGRTQGGYPSTVPRVGVLAVSATRGLPFHQRSSSTLESHLFGSTGPLRTVRRLKTNQPVQTETPLTSLCTYATANLVQRRSSWHAPAAISRANLATT